MNQQQVLPGGIFFLRGWLIIFLISPVIVVSIFSTPWFALGSAGDLIFQILGLTFLIAAVLWRSWATLYVGGKKTIEIVTAGPYAVCRHPLYFGSTLTAIGIAILLQSLLVLISFIAFGWIVYRAVIREEERALITRHGSVYLSYQGLVPRKVIPTALPAWENEREFTIDLRAFRNQARRSMTTLLAYPVCRLLLYAKAQGVFPFLLDLP